MPQMVMEKVAVGPETRRLPGELVELSEQDCADYVADGACRPLTTEEIQKRQAKGERGLRIDAAKDNLLAKARAEREANRSLAEDPPVPRTTATATTMATK